MVIKGAAPARRQRGRQVSGRAKISVTVERSALDAVQGVTDNVSEFVNNAIKEKLYFSRLDEEAGRLQREGIELNDAGYRWLLDRIDATRRRIAGSG